MFDAFVGMSTRSSQVLTRSCGMFGVPIIFVALTMFILLGVTTQTQELLQRHLLQSNMEWSTWALLGLMTFLILCLNALGWHSINTYVVHTHRPSEEAKPPPAILFGDERPVPFTVLHLTLLVICAVPALYFMGTRYYAMYTISRVPETPTVNFRYAYIRNANLEIFYLILLASVIPFHIYNYWSARRWRSDDIFHLSRYVSQLPRLFVAAALFLVLTGSDYGFIFLPPR